MYFCGDIMHRSTIVQRDFDRLLISRPATILFDKNQAFEEAGNQKNSPLCGQIRREKFDFNLLVIEPYDCMKRKTWKYCLI